MADQENTNQNENVPNEEEINTDPVQNEEEKVEPNEEKTEETTHQEENVTIPESNYSPGTNMAQYENVISLYNSIVPYVRI